jgi:RNA polymerase sigma-70 factor (ECF subfamily)
MRSRFFDTTSALNAVIHHDDAHAFEFLFDAFYDKLLRVGLYYLEKDELAEDVVSEVFYTLWSNRRKLPKVENLENYLFTMTKNRCLSALRRKGRIMLDDNFLAESQQIVLENPESNLISEEFIRFYNDRIQDLPPKCKLVYLMVKEDGLKYKEVADLLTISVKTVENHMVKAIAYVRNCISSYEDYHMAKGQADKS